MRAMYNSKHGPLRFVFGSYSSDIPAACLWQAS